jgi:signal transduction histidine kinase
VITYLVFERPRRYSLRWWTFDLMIAIAVGLITTAALNPPSSDRWALVMVAPLILRRAQPIAVFALVIVLAVVINFWDLGAALNLSLVVALYTVAAQEDQRRALIAAGVLEVLVLALLFRLDGSVGWWNVLIFGTGMVAAALGLGLYSSTRQAYLEELQARAARLEHERDQQQELAAAAERARITREMHDIVAHHLTVIVALSTGAAKIAATSPVQAGEVMVTVSDTGRQALSETRRLLSGLTRDSDRPSDRHPVPDLDGLPELLATVRTAGLPVGYGITGTPVPVDSSAQLTVFRLVQEALTNTLKHAGAGARADVRLTYLPGELQVVIDDDGSGLVTVPAPGPGRGLAGMNERVHAFGGEVQSGPRTPRGWRVSARLRLDQT